MRFCSETQRNLQYNVVMLGVLPMVSLIILSLEVNGTIVDNRTLNFFGAIGAVVSMVVAQCGT